MKFSKFKSLAGFIALFLVMLFVSFSLPASAQSQDTYGTTTTTTLVNPQRFDATFTSTGVNLSSYIGQPVILLTSTNINGTNPTMAAKLQQSADNTNFADIAGATFTTVTSNSVASIPLDTTAFNGSNYVRAVLTIGGTTPTNVTGIVVIGRKKYN